MQPPKKYRMLFPRRRGKYSLFIVLFFFLLAAHYLYQEHAKKTGALPKAQVTEVNDGDTVTLRMNGTVYKTRLIGIDAPELGQRPWGRKAAERLRELLDSAGWTVSVETDIEQYDKYGRLLAYLWSDQKNLINEQMLRDGYAVMLTIPPDVKYARRFLQAQKEARDDQRGIWGKKGLRQSPSDYREKHPR